MSIHQVSDIAMPVAVGQVWYAGGVWRYVTRVSDVWTLTEEQAEGPYSHDPPYGSYRQIWSGRGVPSFADLRYAVQDFRDGKTSSPPDIPVVFYQRFPKSSLYRNDPPQTWTTAADLMAAGKLMFNATSLRDAVRELDNGADYWDAMSMTASKTADIASALVAHTPDEFKDMVAAGQVWEDEREAEGRIPFLHVQGGVIEDDDENKMLVVHGWWASSLSGRPFPASSTEKSYVEYSAFPLKLIATGLTTSQNNRILRTAHDEQQAPNTDPNTGNQPGIQQEEQASEEPSHTPSEGPATPDDVVYPSADDLVELHTHVVAQYAAMPGLKPDTLSKLEAAVGRTQSAMFGQQFYPEVAEKAAVLAHSIITSHPFLDANKRVAYAAAHLMLEENGLTIPDSDDLADIVLEVASGRHPDHTILYDWLAKNIQRIKTANSNVVKSVEEIAEEVQNDVIREQDYYADFTAQCLDCANILANALVAEGYTDVKLVVGKFVIDVPDAEAYTDWNPDDFDSDEEMQAEMYTPLHYWVEVDGKILDITANQFNSELENDSMSPIVYGNYSDYPRYIKQDVKAMWPTRRYVKRADSTPGGKGDTLNPQDVDADELQVGIAVELEHTHNRQTAMEIALDHLSEKPDYYSRLLAADIVDEQPALDLATELGMPRKTADIASQYELPVREGYVYKSVVDAQLVVPFNRPFQTTLSGLLSVKGYQWVIQHDYRNAYNNNIVNAMSVVQFTMIPEGWLRWLPADMFIAEFDDTGKHAGRRVESDIGTEFVVGKWYRFKHDTTTSNPLHIIDGGPYKDIVAKFKTNSWYEFDIPDEESFKNLGYTPDTYIYALLGRNLALGSKSTKLFWATPDQLAESFEPVGIEHKADIAQPFGRDESGEYNFEAAPFAALPPEVREKVVNSWGEHHMDYEWWDSEYDYWKTEVLPALGFVYDDIEINFSGFWSQGDGASFTGSLDVERYMIARQLQNTFPLVWHAAQAGEVAARIVRIDNRYSHSVTVRPEVEYQGEYQGQGGEYQEQGDDLGTELDDFEAYLKADVRELSDKLYSQLETEYESLTSEEAIADTADANDWQFTPEGRLASFKRQADIASGVSLPPGFHVGGWYRSRKNEWDAPKQLVDVGRPDMLKPKYPDLVRRMNPVETYLPYPRSFDDVIVVWHKPGYDYGWSKVYNLDEFYVPVAPPTGLAAEADIVSAWQADPAAKRIDRWYEDVMVGDRSKIVAGGPYAVLVEDWADKLPAKDVLRAGGIDDSFLYIMFDVLNENIGWEYVDNFGVEYVEVLPTPEEQAIAKRNGFGGQHKYADIDSATPVYKEGASQIVADIANPHVLPPDYEIGGWYKLRNGSYWNSIAQLVGAGRAADVLAAVPQAAREVTPEPDALIVLWHERAGNYMWDDLEDLATNYEPAESPAGKLPPREADLANPFADLYDSVLVAHTLDEWLAVLDVGQVWYSLIDNDAPGSPRYLHITGDVYTTIDEETGERQSMVGAFWSQDAQPSGEELAQEQQHKLSVIVAEYSMPMALVTPTSLVRRVQADIGGHSVFRKRETQDLGGGWLLHVQPYNADASPVFPSRRVWYVSVENTRTGFSDNPIYYDWKDEVAYDRPEAVPRRVRQAVHAWFAANYAKLFDALAEYKQPSQSAIF